MMNEKKAHMVSESWMRMPYKRKPFSNSTLMGMKKSELIQIIRDYEHNYEALYIANERGIEYAEKNLVEKKEEEWKEVWDENEPIFFRRKFYCSACGDYNTYGKSDYCPNCGAKMKRERSEE